MTGRVVPVFVDAGGPEIRSTAAAVLDKPTTGKQLTRISGRAVPYNRPTDIGPFVETFSPGAFRDSIAATPSLPLLTYHDATRHPIGVSVAWEERADGLYGTWRLDSSAAAQEAARLVAGGFLSFLSIRFAPDRDTDQWEIRGDREYVTRTRARLLEVSLVSTPAYAEAVITGVRDLPPDPVLELVRHLHAPLLAEAIKGTPEQVRHAAGIVRLAVDEYGAGAPEALGDMALSARRPELALNLARAASALEGSESRLAHVHVDRWREWIRDARGPVPAVAPRRRR